MPSATIARARGMNEILKQYQLFHPWLLPALVLALGTIAAAGCLTQGPGEQENGSIRVAVTLLPQAEMARSVGGEQVCVTVVVPPGSDPHTYEPSASQLVALSQARIYFRLGPGLLPLEDGVVDRLQAMNPGILVVDTSAGIERLSGGEGGQGYDPHVWLSPVNARIMVENIGKGYIRADPGGEAGYTARRDAYVREINRTDESIRAALSGKAGEKFLVVHPAWGYFARDYGLEQVAIEPEGKEPSSREIARIIAMAREEGIRVVFTEPQFPAREGMVIAREINGTVTVIDPLAPDYLANEVRVARAIAAGGAGNGG